MTSSWCQTHTGHMHAVANQKGLPHICMVKIKVQLEITTPKYWHKGSSNVQERLAVHLASDATAPSPSSMKTHYKLLDCGLHLRVYVTSLGWKFEHQPGGRPTQFLLTELRQASTTKLCRLGFDIPQDIQVLCKINSCYKCACVWAQVEYSGMFRHTVLHACSACGVYWCGMLHTHPMNSLLVAAALLASKLTVPCTSVLL